MMGINFPNAPVNGQVFTPANGNTWIYNSARNTWKRNFGTALPANKVVNPSMQISQQNGVTAGSVSGYYPADQWRVDTTTLAFSTARVASTNAVLTPFYISTTISTAKPTLAAGDYIFLYTFIEGNRIADLQWGTANAKPIVVRFSANANPGTYAFFIRNGNSTRSYVVPITFGGQQVFTIAIPGCTDGQWNTDNSVGMTMGVCPACGTTYSTASPNSWQAGNYIAFNGMSNLAANAGQVIYLAQVGLYADPNNTGLAPEFQQPDYHDDLMDCLRYWYPIFRLDGVCNSATNGYGWTPNFVPMRIAPTFTQVGAPPIYDYAQVPAITSIGNYNTTPEASSLLLTNASATFTAGRPFKMLVNSSTTNYIAASARM